MPRIPGSRPQQAHRQPSAGTEERAAAAAERAAALRHAKQVQRVMSGATATLLGASNLLQLGSLARMPPPTNLVTGTSPLITRIQQMQAKDPTGEKLRLAPLEETKMMCMAPEGSRGTDAPPVQAIWNALEQRDLRRAELQENAEREGVKATPLNADDVRVWTRENGPESQGQTRSVSLDGAQSFPDGSIGTARVRVRGQSQLSTLNGHAPYDAQRYDVRSTTTHENAAKSVDPCHLTVDAFDQVLVLHVATTLLDRLERYGIDLDDLQRADDNNGQLVIEVNASLEANAWYSSSENRVVLGDSRGNLHLASDADVVVHEIAHYLIHQIAGLDYGADDAGALHEGIADAVASLFHNDPELGESFQALDGAHVRNAHNDRVYDQSGAHEGAEPVSGTIWDARNSLTRLLDGDDAKASDLMLKAVIHHLYRYETDTPDMADFARHLEAEVRDVLETEGLSSAQIEEVATTLRASAERRLLQSGGDVPRS